MNTFLKAAVIVIVAVVLSVSLPKYARDFSVVMSIGACACILVVICYFLDPIVSAFRSLAEVGKIENALLEILLKVTGVGILAEFVSLVCIDSGNSAMGKGIQILSSVVILWLSLPLFTTLMNIVKNVLMNS